MLYAPTTPPDGYWQPERIASLYPGDVGLRAPTDPQLRFLLHPALNRLLVGGFGAGKTTIAAYALLLEAAHPANHGRVVAALHTTDEQSAKVHRPLFESMNQAFADRHGFSFILREDKGLNTYQTIWGTQIQRIGYRRNVKRTSGQQFAAMWVDEIDREILPPADLLELLGRCRAGGTQRTIWTTNPNGDDGVVRMFLRALEGPDPKAREQYATFRAPSWTNPSVTLEELRRLRLHSSDLLWESLVCGNIERATKAVLPDFSRARHIESHWWPEEPSKQPFVIAIDWGQTHAHVTAAFLRGPAEEQMVVFEERHLMDCTDEDVIQAAVKICAFVGAWPKIIFADGAPNAKEANGKLVAHIGTACQIKFMRGGDKAIVPGIRLIRSALRPPPGADPALLLHERICGASPDPHGTLAAVEGSNRKQNKDGDLLDDVAENRRLEHALDCLRYLCAGVWGLRGHRIYGSIAA